MAEERKQYREKKRQAVRSGERDLPACVYEKKCGGCQYLRLPYPVQLAKKQKTTEDLLKGFGPVQRIIGMEDPFWYRNKVHRVFGWDRKGNVICGTYQEGTHRILPVGQCYIEDKVSQEIIRTIKKLAVSFKIKIYDEDTGQGLLRHVLVRRARATGETMVVLVLANPVLPSKNHFLRALVSLHPEITTVVVNVNDRHTSMVLGGREEVAFGRGYITDRLCGLEFRISARSFYQVNPVQTEILYRTAIAYAGLTGKETVIDAYCGIGTIGMVAASSAGRVLGVELNREAVRDAKENARLNHVENIRFLAGDAGEYMMRMAKRGERADVIFMDPPRAGSTRQFMDSAAAISPTRIVYISCNPVTLARDLEYLRKKGYGVERIQTVDMFPFTSHCETVCLLSKLRSDKHIEVEVKMDELDLTAAESKATYEEIKAYVLEKFGLKVSSLYISQIKRKCGIIERANYNLPKSENFRQPQCPPEKEKAIRAALEHFQMI